MRYTALSDIGLKRDKNEDNWNIVLDAEGNPVGFVVADGMGGHLAGEEASRIAVAAMSAAVYECVSQNLDAKTLQSRLTEKVNEINQKIMNYSMDHLGGLNSGTTLSVGLVMGRTLHMIHVGDSRIYLIRERSIRQLTKDHSYVAELFRGGLISAEEAHHHPDRNRITRALGFKDNFYPDFYSEPILAGDVFLFCTDGLYEHVENHEILHMVLNEPREALAKSLIEKAKERGGSDNITAVIAWM